MSSTRIQVLLAEEERALIRQEARLSGMSVSGWVRNAALEKLRRSHRSMDLATVDDLKRFFAACDERETGCEPDWEEHLEVMRSSMGSGKSGT